MAEECLAVEVVAETTRIAVEQPGTTLEVVQEAGPMVLEVQAGEDCCVIELLAEGPTFELMDAADELVFEDYSTFFVFECGTQGPPGPAGSRVRYGEGPPDDALGANGDTYVNELTGAFYEKEAGEYALRLDLLTAAEVAAMVAGRQQFFLGASGAEPAPVAGLPILFFETGLTADPEDVIPSVIIDG